MVSALANLDLASLEKQHGLPAGLLSAVAKTESAGDPNAVSPKGATGLFQFMPQTAKAYGINPLDPQSSAIGAARMYGDLSKQYNGDIPSMLAAYNWGSGNLSKHGIENAPKETQDYIAKITGMLPKQYADSGEIMSDELPPGFTLDKDNSALPEGFTLDTPEPVKMPTDAATSFMDNLAQGAFGLGDEASAGLAALYLNATEGKPLEETYQKGIEIKRNQLEQESNDSPIASVVGQLVGAVGSGLSAGRLAGGALGKFAPKTAETLGGAIENNPIKSTAGLSALQGALYGYGAGANGADSRLESATAGGIIGGTVGGLAGYAGKVLADRVPKESTIEKVATTFGRKVPSKAMVPMEETEAALAPEFIPALSQKQGEIFSKTAGQRLQNAETQRLENSALSGNLSPKANQALKDAVTIQNQQFKGYVNKLAGGIDEAADANSLMDNVANAVKTSADDALGAVDSAYKVAREGGNVKIGSGDIRQGLFKNISGLRRERQYDLSQMPQAKSVVKRLAKYTAETKGNKISSVKLGELENWRTMATTAAQNTGGSEAAFLKGMVRRYDDFMEKTASEAVDTGDAAAINSFKEAVKSRRNYGKLYQSNKIVEDIVAGNKSIEDVTRDLLGTGAIKGRKEMANNLDAILKASGKESDAARSDLQQAFAHKILRNSESGFLPDSQDKLISPAKLSTQLKNLFQEQRTFAEKLYGKDAVADGLKAIKELDLIAQKQAKVGSSSGSGEVIEGLMKKAGILTRIPGLNLAADNYSKTMQGNKVLKGLDEFMPPNFKPSASIFRKYVGPISSVVGIESAPRDKMQITVHPENELPEINLPTIGE